MRNRTTFRRVPSAQVGVDAYINKAAVGQKLCGTVATSMFSDILHDSALDLHVFDDTDDIRGEFIDPVWDEADLPVINF